MMASAALHSRTAAGSRLPYGHHVDDMTIATRDGMLCQFIHVAGLPFETADTEDLNYRHAIRESLLRGLNDPHLALYHHILRRPVTAALQGESPNGFCAEVDAAWRARLAGKQMYVNDLFLTLVRRPLGGRSGLIDAAIAPFRRGGGADTIGAGLGDLNNASNIILRSLAAYGARQLTAYQTEAGICSEPLEFLSFLYNGELRPVLLPRADVGMYLPQKRVSFGGDTIDLKGATEADRRFSAMLSIKDYPAATSPGLLDNLLRLPHEMVVSQSFGFVDR